jgi:hypothetical protein
MVRNYRTHTCFAFPIKIGGLLALGLLTIAGVGIETGIEV